ncbi:unnamed protein product, partial [marine sediment metagenome]
MKTIVALSYFNRKIGPLVFFSYPKNSLDKGLSVKIANIMDQQYSEGFFTHSFENLKSINYYFEINSKWARGYKEMLMVSIILDQQISPEIEESMSALCKRFSEKMKSEQDIFTGFYINDLKQYEEDKDRVLRNESLIKKMVQDLYWETLEETKKKSEEEDKDRVLRNELEIENEKVIPYCKHCGAELPKGQTICHICGNSFYNYNY